MTEDNGTHNGQGSNGDGASGAGAGGETPPAESKFATFDEFLEAQPEEVRSLYEKKTSGLSSALTKEREAVKAANAQLRELAKTADPETRKALEKTAAENEARSKSLEKELEFTRKAVKAGVVDVDLAWAAAKNSETYDLEALRKAHPLLFGPVKTPDARAGSGTNGRSAGKAAPADTMTRAIRQAAGRE